MLDRLEMKMGMIDYQIGATTYLLQ